jgi:FlaA1/EpsC-like NDP-sugar epimerase
VDRILVTGGHGSIGAALVARIMADAAEADGPIAVVVRPSEKAMDVRDRRIVDAVFDSFAPTLVYHLAGAKHAPEGELDPAHVLDVNANGTRNILASAQRVAARVVTASTCKACDPETAYGASKLLAERMTLAAGGSVARFYNVPESCENVFATWAALPEHEPIPVTDCTRFFVSIDRAVELLLACGNGLGPGRYTTHPGSSRWMLEVARELYPDRDIVRISRRRGDRQHEPRHAACEHLIPLGGQLERIVSPHDEAL